MFAHIRGRLISATPQQAVVAVGGSEGALGYRLAIPLSTYNSLPPLASEVFLHLSCLSRDDGLRLYAFCTAEERDLFEQCVRVSGIGPKIALALIGHLQPTQFQQAVQRGDIESVCRVPGIGRKTAQRLFLDIRENMDAPLPLTSNNSDDAVRALVHLGYPRQRAQEMVRAVQEAEDGEKDLAALITAALRRV